MRQGLLVALGLLATSALAADTKPTVFSNEPYQGVLGVVVDPIFRVNSSFTIFPASSKVRCESPTPAQVARGVEVPPYTLLRVSQNTDLADENSWRVFVYSIPDAKGAGEDVIKDKYFKEPFVLCRTGQHAVADDLMRRSGGFNTGILVVPFKLRSGDIFGDSTIGPYVSYHVDRVEVLLTAGLTQVSTVALGSEDVKNETGLTVAAGVKFQIKKDWDIALVVGADRLSGEVGRNWKYQSKPWVSFAVGFSFTK